VHTERTFVWISHNRRMGKDLQVALRHRRVVRPRNDGSPDDETVDVCPTSFGRFPDVIRQLCCRVLCLGRVLRKEAEVG
jgi:hypothetical protein